jgi:hypothetical protein
LLLTFGVPFLDRFTDCNKNTEFVANAIEISAEMTEFTVRAAFFVAFRFIPYGILEKFTENFKFFVGIGIGI